MDIQVEGYPRVCISTLMEITRHGLFNGTETEHSHKDIIWCSEDCKSVTACSVQCIKYWTSTELYLCW